MVLALCLGTSLLFLRYFLCGALSLSPRICVCTYYDYCSVLYNSTLSSPTAICYLLFAIIYSTRAPTRGHHIRSWTQFVVRYASYISPPVLTWP